MCDFFTSRVLISHASRVEGCAKAGRRIFRFIMCHAAV